MKLTPLAIYQREFRRKAINGLDPEDVESFLFQVAEGVEALLSENEELERRLRRTPTAEAAEESEPSNPVPSRAASVRELEQASQEAKRVREAAEVTARRIVEEARTKAEDLLNQARRSAEARGRGTQDPGVARELAREYQSILVQHLSRVTEYLGDSDRPTARETSVEKNENDNPTTQVGATPV